MKKRTHYANAANVDFDYGPYLIKEDEIDGIPNIKELDEALIGLKNLSEEEANGVAKLRQWSAELHRSKEKSDFMMRRMKQVNGGFYTKLKLETMIDKIETVPVPVDEKDKYHYKSKVNDLITLSSFKSPVKKSKKL